MNTILTADEIYKQLLTLDLDKNFGAITFELAGVKVKMNTTDTVGITLQAWLKQYLVDNNIYFSEPVNTQEFPDFYLSNIEPDQHMLEIKAFNYTATPGFDIANFESYCSSVKNKPYRLDADYIIFGYTMNSEGDIYIKKIWLKKIWEIAGTSSRYALKTQIKRDMIYNIRPNTNFKNNTPAPFKNKEDFLIAIYETLRDYKDLNFADDWKKTLLKNYKNYYNVDLIF